MKDCTNDVATVFLAICYNLYTNDCNQKGYKLDTYKIYDVDSVKLFTINKRLLSYPNNLR